MSLISLSQQCTDTSYPEPIRRLGQRGTHLPNPFLICWYRYHPSKTNMEHPLHNLSRAELYPYSALSTGVKSPRFKPHPSKNHAEYESYSSCNSHKHKQVWKLHRFNKGKAQLLSNLIFGFNIQCLPLGKALLFPETLLLFPSTPHTQFSFYKHWEKLDRSTKLKTRWSRFISSKTQCLL